MNLKKWLAEGRIQPHHTTKQEIANLFKVVDRDMKDANLEGLSEDRRFATAYNAALQLATIVLYASGYRSKAATGHHWVTLMSLPELMGQKTTQRTDYLNTCRSKRNMADYDTAGTISAAELKVLIKEVVSFKHDVILWLQKHHPEYVLNQQ